MKRLLLILALPFLMGQTLRDVTVRDVVLGSVSGASNEQMIPTSVSIPAGDGYWRTTDDIEIVGSEAGALTEFDEGYQGSYDVKFAANMENVTPLTEEMRLDFDTPASSPTATVNAQAIRVVITKTNPIADGYQSAQADPTFDLRVWDGDSLETIANDIDCGTWNQEEVTPYQWTYEGGSDGSEVYVEVFGNGNGETGTDRRRCGIEAIDWYAEVQ